MTYKLYFSGFNDEGLQYTPNPNASDQWVEAVNGQDLGENCLISPYFYGVHSFGGRKLTVNNVEYTLGSGGLEITLKDTDVNIVLGDLDTPAEPTSPDTVYFNIYYSYTDTSKLIIGYDSLHHFKEKQDSFNEGKFALKINTPYIIEGDHYINKDTKKIIQKGSSSNEQLSLSFNEILLKNENYLYRVDFTNGIVYGKNDSSNFHHWMNNDGYEIGDANNQLAITPTLLAYKNLKTSNGAVLQFSESSIYFKYFLNNNEFQVNIPNGVNGTLGLTTYRHDLFINNVLYITIYSSSDVEIITAQMITQALKAEKDIILTGCIHFTEDDTETLTVGYAILNSRTNEWRLRWGTVNTIIDTQIVDTVTPI